MNKDAEQVFDPVLLSQVAAEARQAHPLLQTHHSYPRLYPIGEALTLQPEAWYGEPGSTDLSGVTLLWLVGLFGTDAKLKHAIPSEEVPLIVAIDRHRLGVEVLEKHDMLRPGLSGVALLNSWDPLFGQLWTQGDVIAVVQDSKVVWVTENIDEAQRVAQQLVGPTQQ